MKKINNISELKPVTMIDIWVDMVDRIMCEYNCTRTNSHIHSSDEELSLSLTYSETCIPYGELKLTVYASIDAYTVIKVTTARGVTGLISSEYSLPNSDDMIKILSGKIPDGYKKW